MANISNLSDHQLIQLLKEDEAAAFTEIYNRYIENLAGFAGSKLHRLEDAHDILHDIFVKLWEDRHTLTITDSLKSYLYSATRYRIIDKIRRNVTREDFILINTGNTAHDNNSIEEIIEAKELQKEVERSIIRLPPRTQEIFQLSRNKHYSISKIAQKLNLSEQTVKNQLTTALKHIRQSIKSISIFFYFL